MKLKELLKKKKDIIGGVIIVSLMILMIAILSPPVNDPNDYVADDDVEQQNAGNVIEEQVQDGSSEEDLNEIIYSLNYFSMNLTYSYWKFQDIVFYSDSLGKTSLNCRQISDWDYDLEEWKVNPSFYGGLISATDKGNDIPLTSKWIDNREYNLPSFLHTSARSGNELYLLYANSYLINIDYDRYEVGLNWVEFIKSEPPTQHILVKINVTTGILTEFQTENLHLRYIRNFTEHSKKLLDVSWGVELGDELEYYLQTDTSVFDHQKCKYVISEIVNESIVLDVPQMVRDNSLDDLYFRTSNIYAIFYYWDDILNTWVENADFLGRINPVLIGSANSQLIFPLITEDQIYTPLIVPLNYTLSQLNKDYKVIFSSALKSITTNNASLFLELELSGHIMFYNMTFYENGTLLAYNGRTPQYEINSFLDFVLIHRYAPVSIMNYNSILDDFSDIFGEVEGRDDDQIDDNSSIPGYQFLFLSLAEVMGVGMIISYRVRNSQIKRKK